MVSLLFLVSLVLRLRFQLKNNLVHTKASREIVKGKHLDIFLADFEYKIKFT